MAQSADRPSEAPREKRLTIGEVVDLLKDDFPDLSISKLRYLEDRGLLSPTRTKGGYRTFGQGDLRRLRIILTLQRDQYLPLDVIKEKVEQGTGSLLGKPLVPTAPLDSPDALKRPEQTYGWDDALEAAGVDKDFFRRLAEFHVVDQPPGQLSPLIPEIDVEIARVCGILAEYGVQPRNLRLARSAAEREAALLQQVVAPSLRSGNRLRREEGEETLQILGALLAHLLQLFLYRELRSTSERSDTE